jgi:putative heme transporter
VRPFIRWMERRRVPRALATWIALLSGVIIFGGIVTLVVTGIRSEWDNLARAVSEGIDTVHDYLVSGALPIDANQLESFRVTVVGFVTSAEFGSGAIAGVGNIVEVVTGLVLTIVLLFYFLKDGPDIWAFLIKPFRPDLHARAQRVGDRAVGVLGGYVSGTALVAAVDAILIGAALWILQVPLALPLAIIVFVGAFIPIVGATVAGIVAALVALVTNDLVTALIVVAVVVLVNQLEGNLLAPIVLGKSLRLHELVILLALTVGTILGGIVGTFLAVPFAAVAWAVVKAWRDPDAAAIAENDPSRRGLPARRVR